VSFGADIFGLVRDNHTNIHIVGKRKIKPTVWYPQKYFLLRFLKILKICLLIKKKYAGASKKSKIIGEDALKWY